MTVYRVLRSLKVKNGIIRAGSFITSASLPSESLTILENMCSISVLHAPPLNELPDCKEYAQLSTVGIINADQLLEANIDEISISLGIDKSVLLHWQTQVSSWLVIPFIPGGG